MIDSDDDYKIEEAKEWIKNPVALNLSPKAIDAVIAILKTLADSAEVERAIEKLEALKKDYEDRVAELKRKNAAGDLLPPDDEDYDDPPLL